jgi:hypothetical protein
MASPNAPVLESLLNGRGVPKWATSEMELHSLSSGEPGSFLAAVMCHYFPIKRLKVKISLETLSIRVWLGTESLS